MHDFPLSLHEFLGFRRISSLKNLANRDQLAQKAIILKISDIGITVMPSAKVAADTASLVSASLHRMCRISVQAVETLSPTPLLTFLPLTAALRIRSHAQLLAFPGSLEINTASLLLELTCHRTVVRTK